MVAMLASIAGIIVGFYGVVTRPILKLIASENEKTRIDLKGEMKVMRAEIKTEMTAMESRLNQRIDTQLVHR